MLKSSAINAVGFAVPGVLLVPTYAYLARVLSIEDFGLFLYMNLAIALSVLLDLGISRGLVYEIAREQSTGDHRSQLIYSALCAVVGWGSLVSLGGLCVAAAYAVVIHDGWAAIFDGNAMLAIVLVFAIFPLNSFLNTFLAVFEAQRDFSSAAKNRIRFAVANALFPVAFVSVADASRAAFIGLLVARLVSVVAAIVTLRRMAVLSSSFSPRVVRSLLAYSKWLFVTNLVSPFITFFDRIYLAASIGVGSASSYVAMSDLIGKFAALPLAVSRTVFPEFVSKGPIVRRRVLRRAVVLTALGALLLTAPLYLFGAKILGIWLNVSLSRSDQHVLYCLLTAFCVNSVAQLFVVEIQATGGGRLVAGLQALELPLMVILVLYLGARFGAPGVATSVVVRATLDCAALGAIWMVLNLAGQANAVQENNRMRAGDRQ